MLCRKIKAGITVEAAFLMPLICLFICGMIVMTLKLYGNVSEYKERICNGDKEQEAVYLIRLEAMVEQVTKEVPESENGI